MKKDLNEALREAYEGTRRKEKIEIHRKHLKEAIKESEFELAMYEKRMEKEGLDVTLLEGKSVRKLFYNLLGTKDPLMEKERQEFLAAFLKHQAVKKHLAVLKFENKVLRQQAKSLFGIKETLSRLLREKKKLLTGKKTEGGKQLMAMEEKLKAYKNFLKEVKEAKNAGRACLVILEKITKQLGEVHEWGTMQKMNNKKLKRRPRRWVSRATKNAYKAKILLQKFELELLDISDHYGLSYQDEMTSIHLFLELFVDNLIVDWVIQKRINHTLHGVESVHDRVSMILMLLENEIKEVNLLVQKVKKEQKELLVFIKE